MGLGGLKASNKGGDFEIPPAGAHAAVLVAIVDLGTQTESYGGETSEAEKIYLAWEIPGEKTKDGASHLICAGYTKSLNKKANLRRMIEGWRGKQFDDDEEFQIVKILGKPCLLQVVHGKSNNGNNYAKVESVGQLGKGMANPVATHEPFAWEIHEDASKLPDWLPYLIGESVPDKVKKSAEKQGRIPSTPTAPVEAPMADSIPF